MNGKVYTREELDTAFIACDTPRSYRPAVREFLTSDRPSFVVALEHSVETRWLSRFASAIIDCFLAGTEAHERYLRKQRELAAYPFDLPL